MHRLQVLCFAGTYGLALASDLARVLVPGKSRGHLAAALTALGWLVQTLYLGNLTWQSHKPPMTSVFGSLLVLSWILAAIDLYLLLQARRPMAVGLFVLPVVLVLLLVAGLWAPRADWTGWGSRVAFWGTVHGLFLILGAVSTCVAFVAGLMYLAQAARLKHKRPARSGIALPSLEQSERWNRGAITVAFPLLTAGLFLGVALNLALADAAGKPLRWTDPKVLSAGVMWLVFAVLLHVRYRPAMRGRRVVVWTVIASAFLAFAWSVNWLLPSAHGLPRAAARRPPS